MHLITGLENIRSKLKEAAYPASVRREHRWPSSACVFTWIKDEGVFPSPLYDVWVLVPSLRLLSWLIHFPNFPYQNINIQGLAFKLCFFWGHQHLGCVTSRNSPFPPSSSHFLFPLSCLWMEMWASQQPHLPHVIYYLYPSATINQNKLFSL